MFGRCSTWSAEGVADAKFPRTLSNRPRSWLANASQSREGKGAAMFHHPHDPEFNSSRLSQSAVARWARQEAKSEAMIDDVLAASGAAPDALTNKGASRRLPLAALALLGAGVLASIAIASLALSLPRPDADADAEREHLTTGAPRESHANRPPRFWGPYHP